MVQKSITPGLSSFSQNPQGSIPYIDSLLQQTNEAMTNFDIHNDQLSIYIYATAGMRKLTEEQQTAIYTVLKNHLATRGYAKYEVKTITGRDEAIYDWVGANYLAGTFLNESASVGTLDMGGASAQITFEVKDQTVAKEDLAELKIGKKTYQLFAHSFLGLGADVALKNNSIPACFPNGYKYAKEQLGAFQTGACQDHITSFLNSYSIDKIVPKVPDGMKFYAFSKYYYVSNLYKITETPIPFVINYINNKFCNQNNWAEMQEKYPLINPNYLNSQCFSGEYVYVLLKRFGFSDTSTNLEIVDQINSYSVGWNIGAALSLALK